MNLAKIGKIIEWYNRIPPDFSDIDTLMSARRKLACELFGLAAVQADLYRLKNETEFIRKSSYMRARQEHLKVPGTSQAAATALAETAVIGSLEEEQKADAEYRKGALLWTAIEAVLSAMAQQISHLKAEKQQEFNNTGSQF